MSNKNETIQNVAQNECVAPSSQAHRHRVRFDIVVLPFVYVEMTKVADSLSTSSAIL